MTGTDDTQARQISDTWQRIDTWLRDHAPATHAALRPGAAENEIAAVQDATDARIPHELKTLWRLTAGDNGINGAGFLLGNQALMSLDAVTAFHRQQMNAQRHEETLNANRQTPGDDQTTIWKTSWIPVCSFGVTDRTSGLYLDTETGYLGHWSRYNEDRGDEDERDTLTTYLEEIADSLETPSLATRDKPGLINGALVWGSMINPDQEDQWVPFEG
ncbi:SMI1/KNR4 family protein [Streptomyces sp. NPDC048479]|uniref:SMI1/KNR4 family protein n=1 Tax=Streptomyces sp. NPDC048479 TaxID=3154725 RepID=UPI0034440FCA